MLALEVSHKSHFKIQNFRISMIILIRIFDIYYIVNVFIKKSIIFKKFWNFEKKMARLTPRKEILKIENSFLLSLVKILWGS